MDVPAAEQTGDPAILQAHTAQEIGTLLAQVVNSRHVESSTAQKVIDRTQGMLCSNTIQATDTYEIQVEIAEETPPISVTNGAIVPVNIQRTVDYDALDNKLAEKQTQSLSWGELTLEMLSDIVSQQVIQVSQIGLAMTPLMHGQSPGCCCHMRGIRWKDLLDMIISSHNSTCQHTGVVFSHSTVQVGVVLEAGGTEQGMRSIYKGCAKTDATVQTLEDHTHQRTSKTDQVKGVDAETQTIEYDDVVVNNNQGLGSCRSIKEYRNNEGMADSLHQRLQDDIDQTMHDLDENESIKSAMSSVSLNKDKKPSKSPQNVSKVSKKPWSASHQQKDKDHKMETETDQSESATGVSEFGSLSRNLIKEEADFVVDIPVKGLPAQCPVCKNRFRSRTLLKRHSVVHDENHNRHPCPHCDKVCKTACYLQRHMATHFKPEKRTLRTRKGRSSQTKVPTRKTQKRQKEKKHKAPSQCTICQKTFTIARNLTRHMSIHARNNKFPCPHCDKVCRSEHYLQLHVMVHAEEKQYKCTECVLSFGAMHQLKQHRTKEHQVFEQHQCSICDAIYKHKTTLEDHMLDHSSNKSYLCPMCGKTFNRPSVYRLHVAYHASRAKPDAHPCQHCTKSYTTKGLLNKHVRSAHLKERNHKCTVCNMGFFTKQQRLNHEQVHKDTPTHICSFCKKGFAQKHTLVAHQRMHTGERPFLCQHCGKGFTSKPHKVKHEQIHSAIRQPHKKPFNCKVCNAAFRNRTACTDHEKRHAGIKDHKCEFCFVAFVTRGDLVRHLKTHTSGKPFKCQHCDMAFGKKLELTEHEPCIVQVPITVTLLPL